MIALSSFKYCVKNWYMNKLFIKEGGKKWGRGKERWRREGGQGEGIIFQLAGWVTTTASLSQTRGGCARKPHGARATTDDIKYMLCIHLTGPKDAQTFGQTLLWVSVRLFRKEINIWIIRLSKADCPLSVGDPCPIGCRSGVQVFYGFQTQTKTLTFLGSWVCQLLDFEFTPSTLPDLGSCHPP